MHPSGAILDLEFEEWETLRAAAVQASRAETASEAEGHHATWLTPPVSDAAWHDARARDAEQDSDTFGANWHLDRLIQLQPDQWQHYARRGDALLQAGQVAEAAADFNQAAERLGAPAELLHWQSQKALDAQKRKQWPEALWYMTALIAAQPGDVELYVQRADVHEQQGHQTELVADLERAVELDAGVEVVRRLIDQRASLGQWEQAKELFGAVAPEQLALSDLHHHALVQLKSGDEVGYRDLCADLVEPIAGDIDPSFTNAIAWLCAVGPAAEADAQRAATAIEQVLADIPADAKDVRYSLLNTLGAVLYRAGSYQQAIDRFNEGLALHGSKGQLQDWIFLAMAHHQLGHSK
jgi:tetratricopeptide (TPR) repeat protein